MGKAQGEEWDKNASLLNGLLLFLAQEKTLEVTDEECGRGRAKGGKTLEVLLNASLTLGSSG